jgi:hypothetical protein
VAHFEEFLCMWAVILWMPLKYCSSVCYMAICMFVPVVWVLAVQLYKHNYVNMHVLFLLQSGGWARVPARSHTHTHTHSYKIQITSFATFKISLWSLVRGGFSYIHPVIVPKCTV